jgi:hypothetical protein
MAETTNLKKDAWIQWKNPIVFEVSDWPLA